MSLVFRRSLVTVALATAFLLVASPSSQAQSQNWAADMFQTKTHDFRTVGRGTKSEFHFVFKNKFEEDVHVAAVRTSCGCTTPRITKQTLKTHEEASIIAKFNTDTFVGQKGATITVVFDRPYYAEVQLKVSGFIRTDVTFTPNEVAYGEIKAGDTPEKEVVILYSGNSNWQITDVRSHCDHLQVRLDPPERRPGSVQYKMYVKLKPSMPEGAIRERITLISNDRVFPTTEMSIAGYVRPSLSISPAAVSIGTASPGQMVEKRLLVRGEQPFEIKEVVCADKRFEFDIPEGSKKLHFVKLRFKADEAASKVGQEIRVVTNLEDGKSASCIVTGSVMAQ